MDSLTKNKKTNHEIENLLKHALCLEADVETILELTKGSFNAVYKIAMSNGNQYVLKIAPDASTPILRNEKNIMAAEVEALNLIKTHTSVPAPQVLYYSDYSSYCDSPFMIMQCMNGEDYQYVCNSYSHEVKKNVLFELGTMTYDFHQIRSTTFGTLGNNTIQFPTWSESFSAFFKNILEDGIDANVQLPFDYDYFFKLLERVNPLLNDVKTPCLVHGDLWLGNVLVHNEKISALLDFERSLWGDPLMEYPFGLLRNNSGFLRGYKHLALDVSNFSLQIRRTIYNLYHYLIGVIEKPYRGFKEGTANYFVNQKIIEEADSIEKLFSK